MRTPQRDPSNVLPAQTPPETSEALSEAQEPALPNIDALIGLLTDKRFHTRAGAVVWIWTAVAPFAALYGLVRLLDGNGPEAALALFCALTGWKLLRLANALDLSNGALQTPLDKSYLGALSEAMVWPNRRVRGIARHHLTRLLGTLTEEDTGLLNEVQRAAFWSQLTLAEALKRPKFVLALLQAAERLGDEEAIPFVARLARQPLLPHRLHSIRAAARLCLPQLEQRVFQQRLAQGLSEPMPGTVEGAEMSGDAEQRTPEQEEIAARVDAQLKALEAAYRNAQQPGMRPGFLIAAWSVCLPYAIVQFIMGLKQGNGWQMLLSFGFTIGTVLLYRLTLTRKHREVAKQLAEMDDIQAIGRLAEALEWPDSHIRHIAIQALTRLLPRLQASDASLLNAKQRFALYRTLTMSYARTYAKFLTALLKALEQVGDAAAIPYVETLIKSKPFTAAQQRVVETARECLPFLQQQAMQEQYSHTLLRAASAVSSPPEDLLRAVFETPDREGTHLLRASIAESRETK